MYAAFLDQSIKVHDRRFRTKLFDTRDAFPFYISSLPYLDSNITSEILDASVGSQIVINATTTTNVIIMALIFI